MPVEHAALFLGLLRLKVTEGKFWWIHSANSPVKKAS